MPKQAPYPALLAIRETLRQLLADPRSHVLVDCEDGRPPVDLRRALRPSRMSFELCVHWITNLHVRGVHDRRARV